MLVLAIDFLCLFPSFVFLLPSFLFFFSLLLLFFFVWAIFPLVSEVLQKYRKLKERKRKTNSLLLLLHFQMSSALPTITVDVYSDIACPWCFIGDRSLTQAIENTKNTAKTVLNFRPYVLHPMIPAEVCWHSSFADKDQL